MRFSKRYAATALIAFAVIAVACGSTGGSESATGTPSDDDVRDEPTAPPDPGVLNSGGSESATGTPSDGDARDEPTAPPDPVVLNSDSSESASGTPSDDGVQDEPTAPPDPGVLNPDESESATSTPSDDHAQDEHSDRLDPRVLNSDWSTDFSIHSVPLGDFLSGGPPKDGIRSLENPAFISIEEGNQSFVDNEPVIAFSINGDARAYPLGILTQHEIADDVVGGVPVTVTFCPLCNSAIVFESTLDGVVYEFGVSGVLRNSDLVMYDRTTESWWQQFTGEAIVGELTGALLEVVPSSLVSWGDFKDTYPAGQVMSTETGFGRDYGLNPYVGYDSDTSPFLFRGEPDPRLGPVDRVVALDINGDPIAYTYDSLEDEGVIHDTVGGEDIVIFFQFGTASALDGRNISESRDVGATGVFRPVANGQSLTFSADGDDIVDDQTGSRWNLLGLATDGELAGTQLELVPHANHFWFAWAAFKPNTRIYGT
ncbi:MAG: DUF3179 domain-containing protein [Chloroflexi bacterium]|nr:DUF3179 domain-containing protein [Chloroflexota bacterium]